MSDRAPLGFVERETNWDTAVIKFTSTSENISKCCDRLIGIAAIDLQPRLLAAPTSHDLHPAVGKLACGAHKLAEALVGPIIEIFTRVDREFAGFAEGRAAGETAELRESCGRAWDPIAFPGDSARHPRAA